MDPAERQEVKERIQAAIAIVKKDIAALEELTKPISPDNAIGRLSRMEAIGSKSITEANLETARTKLAKLKYALTAIDKEDFGICMECGEPIPIARIMIVPESKFCVSCAE